MNANRSTAVMARRVEAHDSLDDFPTPPWATRALLRFLAEQGEPLHLQHAWDPACNRGYMVRPLAEQFDQVHATDVHDYGWSGQDGVADFLISWGQVAPDVDWVITNPPFRLAADFIRQGLTYARRGVAVLVRTAFVEGLDRYEGLFRNCPEAFVLPFVERVVMWKGALLDPDVMVWRVDPETGEGKLTRPTSATSYAWLVWRRDARGCFERETRFVRIPPCRRDLTRPGDYPPLPDHLTPPQGGLL
ncbi:hypothetical protein [Salipiger mucosus]|uniref:Methyltransferase n=1 Tax=Salipiger mucosus DSM 16094 TaxID=1123237 RepID=S9QKX5_9RHOB|nr:hypothetical protein [Salipiger mucosus]EPX82081.1 hypothetical protein Salmuc_02448 [Salipiger mucosus DSM 16094]